MVKLTIGRKIAALCSLFIGFALFVGVVGVYELEKIDSSAEAAAQGAAVAMAHLQAVQGSIGELTVLSAKLAIARPSTRRSLAPNFQRLRNAAGSAIHDYADLAVTPGWAAGPELRALTAALQSEWDAYLKSAPPSSFRPPALGASLDALSRFHQKAISEQAVVARGQFESARRAIFASVGFCLLIGALLAFGLARDIQRSLASAVRQLRTGAGQVSVTAGQLADSSQTFSRGAAEQIAALEETSASSEEISSMARQNHDSSRAAAELASRSQHDVAEAGQALGDMITAMAGISDQSAKIARIIKTIDEIAFQTNILALNAAVEAARAGEAGLGFAVVAQEVRNLAQRCASAAQETETLISESIAKTADGKSRVDNVAKAIQAITGQAGKIKQLVDQVNVSSQEQANGIAEIGRALTQLDSVSHKTSTAAAATADAAQQLTKQFHSVDEVIAQLEAMISPAAGRAPAAPDRGVLTPALVPVLALAPKPIRLLAAPTGLSLTIEPSRSAEAGPNAAPSGISKLTAPAAQLQALAPASIENASAQVALSGLRTPVGSPHEKEFPLQGGDDQFKEF